MAIVNVPAGSGAHIRSGAIKNILTVYCVGPEPATFGISIHNPPPPYIWHHIAPGNAVAFQIDEFEIWVFNKGPSTIQLLYQPRDSEASSVDETEDVSVIESAAV
ncbi:MAG: hypothetical protein JO345_01360 [Streptosporangiaceae bacterium]|nr:hypothetical protein [Streptosporangiaceae bacterium]